MIHRKSTTPILCGLVLSLVAGCPVIPPAQTAASAAANPEPATATVAIPSVAPVTAPKHTASYTVAKGDSLTSIARKFNTTRKKLRALNNLDESVTKVTPGQVLLVPASKTATAAAKAKAHHEYVAAQPVQDFDVPASTFASCPVPLPEDDPDANTTTDEKPAPIAKLVSPAEMAAEPPVEIMPTTPIPAASAPAVKPIAPAKTKMVAKVAPIGSTPMATSRALPVTPNLPAPRPSHGLAEFFGFGTPPATDWGSRFIAQARALGDKGIEYDDNWRPPGEARAWAMDCSNTSRYLYKVTAGIQLPRTASDQYYYLHLQGKAWDVPLNAYGLVDTDYLRENLKPGDLLFWENTYRPERQPPITHVMVYLGVNDKGQWIMAGSQSSRGGEHNRSGGGPDIYIFRPSQPCGGYTTWMGLVHHKGRFCAFGRPLEADPSKLAVAESE